MAKSLRVAELFAGVGGFRIALESIKSKGKPHFTVVFSNQWEPGKKNQVASDIYVQRFGKKGHTNCDIAKVDAKSIPPYDVLVGGFPCQDYSVAKPLSQAEGLSGKKGVLWWQIHRLLKESKPRPSYILLENVDRLLKSPATSRGRDFAIMLATLVDLGYIVEWHVVNAADYGFPQRRRRVFIIGYRERTPLGRQFKNWANPSQYIEKGGLIGFSLPTSLKEHRSTEVDISADPYEITAKGVAVNGASPFMNAGIAYKTRVGRKCVTVSLKAVYNGKKQTLGSVLEDGKVDESYFIKESDIPKWKKQKGSKSEPRTNRRTGHTYHYSEGSMAFPDPSDSPSRTIVTGEGGSSASRFKHVVVDEATGRLRRLTPVELERLNGFPDNHTSAATPTQRAFLMGNALVVGVVEKIGRALIHALILDK